MLIGLFPFEIFSRLLLLFLSFSLAWDPHRKTKIKIVKSW